MVPTLHWEASTSKEPRLRKRLASIPLSRLLPLRHLFQYLCCDSFFHQSDAAPVSTQLPCPIYILHVFHNTKYSRPPLLPGALMKARTIKIRVEVEIPTKIQQILATSTDPKLFYEFHLLASLKAWLDYNYPVGGQLRETLEAELDELLEKKRIGLLAKQK